MNNEEKILSMLEVLTKDVGTIKEDVGTLKEDVSTLKEDVSILKEDVSILKERVGNLEVGQAKLEAGQAKLEIEVLKANAILENEIRHHISLLSDGHMGVIDRLDNIESQFEKVRSSVEILDFFEIAKSKKF